MTATITAVAAAIEAPITAAFPESMVFYSIPNLGHGTVFRPHLAIRSAELTIGPQSLLMYCVHRY
jgi:hypothetical protein